MTPALLTVPDALPLLSRGRHPIGSSRACALETLSQLMGRPEDGDHPRGVHPLLAAVVATVNDALPDDERQQLWTVLLDLVGTAPDRPARRWASRAERRRELDLALACADAGWQVLEPTRWRSTPSQLSAGRLAYAATAAGGRAGRRAAEEATLSMAARAAAAGLGVPYVRAVLGAVLDARARTSAIDQDLASAAG